MRALLSSATVPDLEHMAYHRPAAGTVVSYALSGHRRDRLHRRAAWRPGCSRPATPCAACPAAPARLRDVPWAGRVEVVEGDLSDAEHAAGRVRRRRRGLLPGPLARPAGLRGARPCRGAELRRGGHGGRRTPDRLPRRTGAAGRRAASRPHLRSRAEVAQILLDSGVPTAVLRAAVIIGSGSASFEMLRYLTERLPVMVTPRWVTQPDPADRGPRRAALPDRRGRRCRPRSTAASTSAARTC